ncbi:hypothetical protein CFP56_042151 [Quercus suber]|uniref:Uncharacterized protein n=1 Tax=Quercus suber TaxID=58331 RepID=A0AAW0M9P3_QUESU
MGSSIEMWAEISSILMYLAICYLEMINLGFLAPNFAAFASQNKMLLQSTYTTLKLLEIVQAKACMLNVRTPSWKSEHQSQQICQHVISKGNHPSWGTARARATLLSGNQSSFMEIGVLTSIISIILKEEAFNSVPVQLSQNKFKSKTLRSQKKPLNWFQVFV